VIAPPPPEQEPAEPQNAPTDGALDDLDTGEIGELEDRIVDAIAAAAHLNLDRELERPERSREAGSVGKSGRLMKSSERGKPIGVRAGDPRRDGRLDLAATLRAAAPWQKLRENSSARAALKVSPADFQVKRTEQRAESVVVFVVDASGSAAMNRMAEAKGAVEQFLGDCYARRDHVAVIAFRRETAELILPPTRALVRARRALAGVPGGGGTPLAAAIRAADALAQSEQAQGRTPILVFLSDGRGNIALDGSPDRSASEADVERCAALLRASGWRTLFFDISPRPSDRAQKLSIEMGAQYAHLPRVDAARVSSIVQAVAADERRP
ncbi:MAG: VWA domain-containing protein, partial [Pseudomonadota bacterium]